MASNCLHKWIGGISQRMKDVEHMARGDAEDRAPQPGRSANKINDT